MKKKNCKVYFYSISCSNNYKLKEVLLSNEAKTGFNYDGKVLEVLYAEELDQKIVGAFVVTKKSGVAPAHKPGTSNFEKVGLKPGHGLGYPNAFIYDLKHNFLQIEFNRDAAYPSKIQEFLVDTFHKINPNEEFHFEIFDMLTADSYKKIDSMGIVNKVNFRVANPAQLISNEIGLNGSLKDFSKLAKEANAQHSMEVTMVGEKDGLGLSKRVIKELMRGITKASNFTFTSKASNRMKVYGASNSSNDDPQSMDVIDLFFNKIKDSFTISEPLLYEGIQFTERKREMLLIHKRKLPRILEIIKVQD